MTTSTYSSVVGRPGGITGLLNGAKRLVGLALALAGFTTWTAPLCYISSRSARSVHAAALPAIEAPPRDLHEGRLAPGFDHQSSQSCQYSISPTGATLAGTGGVGSFNVSTTSGCPWFVSSNDAWITVLSVTSQLIPDPEFDSCPMGLGTVTYSVASGPTPRQGTITLSSCAFGEDPIEIAFTITQAPASCSSTISPNSRSHGAGSETGVITVTAADGCAWQAASGAAWITITGDGAGVGNGTANYSLAANADPTSRTGIIEIAGQVFTITQAGSVPCSFSLIPLSADFPGIGGSGEVTVGAPTGCVWTASSNSAWITITSPGSGSGDGKVNYVVAANTGCRRSETLTIAGQTFSVAQEGLQASCPRIASVSIESKDIVVIGEGFDDGAVILMNGLPQRTLHDPQHLTTRLFGKRLGKKIAPGQTVDVQVRDSDGTLSPEFIFTRSS